MSRLRLLAAFLPLLLAAACAPAAAGAGWDDPVPLPVQGSALFGALAVAPDGRVAATWVTAQSPALPIHTAERRPGEGWSAPAELGGPLRGAPVLAATDDATVLAWAVEGSVDLAIAPPGGPFGAPSRQEGTGDRYQQLAVSPDGWTVASWNVPRTESRPSGRMIAERPPGGAFESPVFFADPGAFGEVAVAVSRGGRAIASWGSLDAGRGGDRRGPRGRDGRLVRIRAGRRRDRRLLALRRDGR